MERLSGLDATFLYLETTNTPMHVAGLIVFDPSELRGEWSIERIKEMYRERLHLAPPFRRRLVEVPFQLHHPLWIEDPDFDLDSHIRHVAVPPPGGMQQLEQLVSTLVEIPLDRTRPLWETWIIEGLENGYVASLTKVHHCAIDGKAGNQIMVSMFDLSPEGTPIPEPEEPWRPDHIPNEFELVGYALGSLARQPVRALKALRRTTEVALNIRRRNRQPDVQPPPAPFAAPRTSFNRPLTPRRTFAARSLPLGEVKQIKNTVGCTVNDVVLALCAGALRLWLDEQGEKPDAPLVAMVPVSVRDPKAKGNEGNEVSSMLTTLATDVDDPLERLRAISACMRQAKEQHNLIGADTLRNWAEFAAPALAGRAARLYSRMKIAGIHRPLFNLTISNVPGPPFPLYLAGGRVIATYPIGPIFDGAGLNITVMSYIDSLDFGLLACPDVLPGVHRIADGLAEALEDLTKAVTRTRPSRKRPKATRSPRRVQAEHEQT
ncbi:MAG: diacylglycerol O-acyltransferase [Acidimicrobiales bacterium]|nr:MAG: diacylglycerol O-acyltransferase [Acidimicrobiales bacterium]